MSPFQVNTEFLKKYDQPGPRYTSYPPAPHFKNDFDYNQYLKLLQESNQTETSSISLYVHIPFCPHRCLFCGCHTEIGRSASEIKAYVQAVLAEMDLTFAHLHKDRIVTQIHFGGGTPNAIPLQFLEQILKKAQGALNFSPNAEIAIECDPNLLSIEKLKGLRNMGFNRISIGLQDFDKKVLDAVERGYPRLEPNELFRICKELGFGGVNLDLIYGLPHQTVSSFTETIHKTITAKPDRIAAFSYAHVPWIKEHQKILESLPSPDAEAKLSMAVALHQLLPEAGYQAIGMDHFALPADSLAKAHRERNLHRNFQGYCTRETTGQVYAFGSSAISQLDYVYGQNIKEMSEYIATVNQGQLPLEKAYFLTKEEHGNRRLINELMCEGKLDLLKEAQLRNCTLSELKEKLQPALDKMDGFAQDGLLNLENNVIQITEKGRLIVRVIAMAFDPLVNKGLGRYSQTI